MSVLIQVRIAIYQKKHQIEVKLLQYIGLRLF